MSGTGGTATGEGLRVAMLSVHTSPLHQAGTGDAGGMNVYVAELAMALARHGTEVEIFTRATSSMDDDDVRLADGVLVRHIPAGPFEGVDKEDLPGQLCAFTAGVLRTEAGRRPGWYSTVHSHYWLSGQVGWLAADRWDVPLVHTMHTLARVKNRTLAEGDVPEPVGRVIGEEQVVAAADALVANTPSEAAELVELYGADPAVVRVVSPGVDVETFSPGDGGREESRRKARAHVGLPEGERVLLFVGRVQPLKGPDVLVRALGELASRGEPVPLLVVLGGPSGRPTALRELRALAAISGVGDRVLFHPPVPREQLPHWYRAADVVAMPSRSESFGLVAAEAQACGVPVLASAVGGLRTVVAHGVSGRLVHGHDPAVWARAVAGLMADHDARLTLGAGAAGWARRFSWDATAEAMLGVYRAAAVRHSAAG